MNDEINEGEHTLSEWAEDMIAQVRRRYIDRIVNPGEVCVHLELWRQLDNPDPAPKLFSFAWRGDLACEHCAEAVIDLARLDRLCDRCNREIPAPEPVNTISVYWPNSRFTWRACDGCHALELKKDN